MTHGSNRRAPKLLGNAATAVEGTRLFIEGDDLYVAMLTSIRSARNSVRMESYIFSDDEVGWQFTQALAERAAAGLDVRLHLDAAGALDGSSQVMERHLRERGGFLKDPYAERRELSRPQRGPVCLAAKGG